MALSVDFFMSVEDTFLFLGIEGSKTKIKRVARYLDREKFKETMGEWGVPVYEWRGQPHVRYTDLWNFCIDSQVQPQGMANRNLSTWKRYVIQVRNRAIRNKKKKNRWNSPPTEKSLFLKDFLRGPESS